jgi:hypothetical protein
MAFSFTDWLARTFFISAADEQQSADVAAHQQLLLNQQLELGKVDAIKYYNMSNQIADTGSQFYDEQLGKSGLAGVPGVIPWWVWPLVIGAAVIYFWPALRVLFNRIGR